MNRRIFRLKFSDVTYKDLEISKAAAIKLDQAEMMHLDKLQDGTWRLLYNPKVIDERSFSQLNEIEIVREDEI